MEKKKEQHSSSHCVDDKGGKEEHSEIFYLPLHYFAPLHSKGIPSFLFDLSIPQTKSECKVRACVYVRERQVLTFRLKVINAILSHAVLMVE